MENFNLNTDTQNQPCKSFTQLVAEAQKHIEGDTVEVKHTYILRACHLAHTDRYTSEVIATALENVLNVTQNN